MWKKTPTQKQLESSEQDKKRQRGKKKIPMKIRNLWRAGHHQFFDQWERLNSSRFSFNLFSSLSSLSCYLSTMYVCVCVIFSLRFRYRLSLNLTRNPEMSEWKRNKSQWSMWIHRKWIIYDRRKKKLLLYIDLVIQNYTEVNCKLFFDVISQFLPQFAKKLISKQSDSWAKKLMIKGLIRPKYGTRIHSHSHTFVRIYRWRSAMNQM